MTRKILTLCIASKYPRILLAMKKRGFGAGRWNGFGGKLKDGESVEAAAKRETEEEIGISISKITRAGIIDFEFQNNPEILEVHIFRADDWSGEPKETEEMKPQWFHVDEIPYEEMWPDDRHWLPLLLAGKKFRGRFLFDQAENTNIIESDLTVVESI